MSRKCPECLESGRAHLPGCSYAPEPNERAAFIKEHAVELVRDLEDKVRRQAKCLAQDGHTIRRLAARVAAQSELLSKRAEKAPRPPAPEAEERIAKLRDSLQDLLTSTIFTVDSKPELAVWEKAAKVLRDEGVEVGPVDDASDWMGAEHGEEA